MIFENSFFAAIRSSSESNFAFLIASKSLYAFLESVSRSLDKFLVQLKTLSLQFLLRASSFAENKNDLKSIFGFPMQDARRERTC